MLPTAQLQRASGPDASVVLTEAIRRALEARLVFENTLPALLAGDVLMHLGRLGFCLASDES